MARIPGWTFAGPMEKFATLVAVPGAPLLFLLIYFLQQREGGMPLILVSIALYVVIGIFVALAAGRERRSRRRNTGGRS